MLLDISGTKVEDSGMIVQRLVAKDSSSSLARPLVVNGVNVTEIVDLFETLGYECQVGAELVGASGVAHPFDIIAKKGVEFIVMDLMAFRSSILDTPSSDYEISDMLTKSVLLMRIKSWDCKPTQRIILHLSSYLCNEDQELSQHDPVRGFLSQFDIKLIKSANMEQATRKLKSFLCEVEIS